MTDFNDQPSTEEQEPQATELKSRRDNNPRLMDLMNRDLSWAAIQDLMRYEISLPFSTKPNRSEKPEPPSEDERWKFETAIGNIMIDRGLIDNDELSEAQSMTAETGQPIWRTLLQSKKSASAAMIEFLNMPISQLFSSRPDDAFCDFILNKGLLSPQKLDEAWADAKASGEEFEAYLRRQMLVSDEDIAKAHAANLDLPFESLEHITHIPAELFKIIPPQILIQHEALPYKLVDHTLHIAFSGPQHIHDLDRLGLLLKADLQAVLAPRKVLKEKIYALLPQQLDPAELTGNTVDESTASPGVELLRIILRGLVKSDGTDIHIEPQRESVRVRYRVDGILHDLLSLEPASGKRVIARVKSLAGMDVAQPFQPQDGHLVIDVDDRPVDFRVATIPSIYGEKMALRHVQPTFAFSSLGHIGMLPEQVTEIRRILDAPNGLVLTCGPVGCGKTTTLYSCINSMDCFTRNIMTIEDPVEYEVAGITQVQVDERRDFHFANGVRALLRQDPDVILVGEIRDEETVGIALRAAMTGTLVLSTLHANSAETAVNSMMYLGIRPFVVANSLTAIIFQRLVRRVCENCAEPQEVSERTLDQLGWKDTERSTFLHGKGCGRCFQTGYHGRTAVYEILLPNQEFRELVTAQPSNAELREAALNAGMVPLTLRLQDLVEQGVTTIEEYMRLT